MHKITMISILALATTVGAGVRSPQEAVRQLTMQLNGKQVDALMGPIDYELVYIKDATDAYPLEEIQRKKEQVATARQQGLKDSLTYRQPKAPVLAQRVDLRGVANSVEVGLINSKSKSNGNARRDSVVGGESAPAPESKPFQPYIKSQRWSRSFVPNPDKAVGVTPPKVRFHGDRAGDPNSFDLTSMNVNALVNRAMPEKLRGRGLKLGAMIAPPSRYEGPVVSRIAQDHSLSERRVMRLELREQLSEVPTGIYLDLVVEELEEKDDRATAQVLWGYTDSEDRKSARLQLQRLEEGWVVVDSWAFIQQLAVGRSALGRGRK